MTIKDLLREAKSRFGKHLALDAEVLLAFYMKMSREQLISNDDRSVSSKQISQLETALLAREKGSPLAYITNEKEFYGLSLYVDERVLIPRPETELLVDHVLDSYSHAKCVFDLGTGSGAIAIAIAKHLPATRVYATDVSTDALVVAKKNAEMLSLSNITFLESDILSALSSIHADVIIANFPYIGEERHRYVSSEAEAFEPHVALFGGHDGLQIYKTFFQQVCDQKRFEHGLQCIAGEFGFAQAEDMQALLTSFFPNKNVTLKPDLAGIARNFFVHAG